MNMDGFVSYVLFDSAPQLVAADLENAISALEPKRPGKVTEGTGKWWIQLGKVRAHLKCVDSQIPEDVAVSSLGMADIDDAERYHLMQHQAYCVIQCEAFEEEFPMTAIILLLKAGMALCSQSGALATCIPDSGICLTQAVLNNFKAQSDSGPRAWGVEEGEQAYATYELYSLWDSLRLEGEPASLVVGFVPAQVDGKTWYFSAGHSLFNMPELACNTGTLEDYPVIRQFFRVAFRRFFTRPDSLKPGVNVSINSGVTMTMDNLPPQYKDFQSSTGTLLVNIQENVTSDQDWD